MDALSEFINIEDFRAAAACRLPRGVFDYLDGGAEAEWSLRENLAAFQEWSFRPRNAARVARCATSDACAGPRWPRRSCSRRSATAA